VRRAIAREVAANFSQKVCSRILESIRAVEADVMH